MESTTRPAAAEFAPYFSRYINLVPDGDLLDLLDRQCQSTVELLSRLPDTKAEYRYEPGKWSVKEVLGHVIDTERVFAFRALWIARRDPAPLPSFEQDDWMKSAGFGQVPLSGLLDSFRTVREATILQFRQLPPGAWTVAGIAGGNPLSVRAALCIIAGHELHHVSVLKAKYL